MTDVTITNHARKRWLQRIIDRQRYEHMRMCRQPNCPVCDKLDCDCVGAIRAAHRSITARIAAAWRQAVSVSNQDFLRVFTERYADHAGEFKFTQYEEAIFVTRYDKEVPTLVTIYHQDMLNETVWRDASPAHLRQVFQRWKREARLKGKK